MDTRDNMIIIKGKIKTSEIDSCIYHADTERVDIKFNDQTERSYKCSDVEWLKEPEILDPEQYHINSRGRQLFNIAAIYVFKGTDDSYWHICFGNGSAKDYHESNLNIVRSVLGESQSANVFEYIKQVAALSDIENGETGEKLLVRKFEKLSFVGSDVALAKYLEPSSLQIGGTDCEFAPVFPFGCNNSQYKAVKRAFENQISIIQGPPGTGKTQTILNIITNILMRGQTVQVVSNNNSAIKNVYEKLSSPKYNLEFVVASLGRRENRKSFVEYQIVNYPDFSAWKTEEAPDVLREKIAEQSEELKSFFDKQERLACLRQELSRITTEVEYFNQYVRESDINTEYLKTGKNLSSEDWMELWQESQMILEAKQAVGFLFKAKAFLKYGVTGWKFYSKNISKIITVLQAMYYRAKQRELSEEAADIERYLSTVNKDLLDKMCSDSMAVLKDTLAKKYGGNGQRKIFSEGDLWKKPYDFLKEYPVVLSTTFSPRSSLNFNVIYDYLIMDEASQVDIATGALALSCARNVVIVGDTRQLPNVVPDSIRVRANDIFDAFNLRDGYQYTRSFLQSVLEVMPDVTQTLLREHYRCHPKIINFCNQKFYRGELIIMTEDNGEKDVLSVVKTVAGNHARDHYSQRQIDVIKKEIIPVYAMDPEETGIIAPYKNQVKALGKEIKDIEAATVHKFQGREKDNIIISTVDDEISDFVDDPYLLNVAVSRAKKRLMLVVTGNRQEKERNITDLIDYIQYNNFEVIESKVNSIFDYLYRQYTEERIAYLQKHKKISEYDSENLMYSLIDEIISDNRYSSLSVVCHFPLNMLIKNTRLLNEKEIKFVMNPAAHLDFLIYNRISKKPVVAIEVDGYNYHGKDTVQAARDRQKDHIMELYEIPLLRFMTNGSGEKEQIEEMLEKLMGQQPAGSTVS